MSRSLDVSNITKSSNAISIFKGETKDIELPVTRATKQPDGSFADLVVDLTSAKITFTMKKTAEDSRPLIKKTTDDPTEIEVVGDPVDGEALIHLVPADTLNMEPGDYLFDIWIELSPTEHFPLVENAKFELKQPVTRL